MNIAIWIVFPLAAVLGVLGGLSSAPVAVTPVDEMAWHVDENPPNPPEYQIVRAAPIILSGPWAEDIPPPTVEVTPMPTPLAAMPKLTPALDEARVRALAVEAGMANVDAAVAVARCESSFHPDAVGGAGELGLWQIHPIHFDYIRATFGPGVDITDPAVNAWYAARLSAGGTDWSHWSCQP